MVPSFKDGGGSGVERQKDWNLDHVKAVKVQLFPTLDVKVLHKLLKVSVYTNQSKMISSRDTTFDETLMCQKSWLSLLVQGRCARDAEKSAKTPAKKDGDAYVLTDTGV